MDAVVVVMVDRDAPLRQQVDIEFHLVAEIDHPTLAVTLALQERALRRRQFRGWLRALPPGHFVLQLFASFTESSVRQFAAAHPGTRVLRLSRDGSPWYVAVTGSFRSKEAARAAVDGMAPELRKLSPWPRSVSALQDELRRR